MHSFRGCTTKIARAHHRGPSRALHACTPASSFFTLLLLYSGSKSPLSLCRIIPANCHGAMVRWTFGPYHFLRLMKSEM